MRDLVVVMVSGRGALASLAGVASVVRHVEAARTLGLGAVVVFPPERRALGAEVRGLVEDHADCIGADQLADHLAHRPDDCSAASVAVSSEGSSDQAIELSREISREPSGEASRETSSPASVLVVAAEWYLSMAALSALCESSAARSFGRVVERGCAAVPLARIPREEAVAIAGELGSSSAATLLARLAGERRDGDDVLDLDPRGEQRLSDNVSTAHAEEKLVEDLFGPRVVPTSLRVRPNLAPRLARAVGGGALGPAGLSMAKLFLGLAGAWILGGQGYATGLGGALIFLGARILGASGAVLARAGFADRGVREKLDLAGDTVLYLAVLWALAGGPARASGGAVLAAVATAGVVLSTLVAYVYVVREAWQARGSGERRPHADVSLVGGNSLVSRFVQRDGATYALVFAAVAGRLDLFLWAAALASHLFYVLWLLGRPRREGGAMAVGRPA